MQKYPNLVFFLRRTDLEMDDGMISWAMVLFIFLFMFSFGVAISSFPWVLMGEKKTPKKQRSKLAKWENDVLQNITLFPC